MVNVIFAGVGGEFESQQTLIISLTKRAGGKKFGQGAYNAISGDMMMNQHFEFREFYRKPSKV